MGLKPITELKSPLHQFREAALNAILGDKESLDSADLETAFEKVGPSIDEATLARFRGLIVSWDGYGEGGLTGFYTGNSSITLSIFYKIHREI